MSPPLLSKLNDPDDRNYMESIYIDYGRLIYSEITKLIGEDPAREDIMQDCLVKLARRVPLLRQMEHPQRANYIITTARNASKNHLRSKSRAAICSLEDDLTEPAGDLTPEAELFKDFDEHEFHMRWKNLDDTTRTLLEGKYILGQSDAQLAQGLHCKSSSVRMLLSRARRKAQAILIIE